MSHGSIYLDHNATTPVDPAVREAMLPYLESCFGNASSVHQFGREAKVALETAREQIAAAINCQPGELIFVSGGTESDNLAVMGTARRLKGKRDHLIVGAAEHHAVLESAEHLHHEEGFELSLLPVDRQGRSNSDLLAAILTEQTSLVSVMYANNETGAVQDIPALAETAHGKGALFHTDAVQAVGKIPVDVQTLGVDMMTFTAHKLYGPKGIGALYVRAGLKIQPLLYGGSHERRRRPGTENVAGAVGFAMAIELCLESMATERARMTELSEYFITGLGSAIPGTRLNSPQENRMTHTVNLSFEGTEGEPVILSLDMEGIAVASGSACTSGATEPSHVLTAMGIDPAIARGAIRFSLGRSTTKAQLDRVIAALSPIVERLRALSPSYQRTR